MAQVIECLASKHKISSSNPSTRKEGRRRKEKEERGKKRRKEGRKGKREGGKKEKEKKERSKRGRRTVIHLRADFSSENMEARSKWNNIIQVLKNYQPQIYKQ
jgi:hypothetical protein